jgi:hypothetical protein
MLDYFFPRSDLERQWAHTEPIRFLVRIFLKGAAMMALALSVIDTARPRSLFDERPVARLGFIVLWSLLMGALILWVARHTRPNQVDRIQVQSKSPSNTR